MTASATSTAGRARSTDDPRVRRTLWVVALTAIVVVLVVLAGPGRLHGYLNTGDSNKLVRGARAVNVCIDEGTFTRCSYDPQVEQSLVGSYSLLQYIPATLLDRFGVHDDSAMLQGLAIVNLVAFVGTLALIAWRSPSPRAVWRPLLLAAMISGPLVFYAISAFGEMLASAVVLAAVVAAASRRPLVAGALVAVACLGKETLAPFVLVLALLAARDDEDGWLPPARLTASIAVGAVAGYVINALFNVFRFGTVGNRQLLLDYYRVTGVRRVAGNVGELIVAPGGGLLLYWPLAMLIVGLAAVVAIALVVEHRWRGALPLLVTLATFVAFTGALAAWYAPFGWLAWGPRLNLPLMAALLFALASVGGEPLTRAMAAILRSGLAFLAMAVVVVALGLAQLSGPMVSSEAVATLRTPDATCPTFGNIKNTPAAYWRCVDHRAFRLNVTPLRTALTADGTLVWLMRGAGAVAIVALLLLARIGARRRPPRMGRVEPAPGRHAARRHGREPSRASPART